MLLIGTLVRLMPFRGVLEYSVAKKAIDDRTWGDRRGGFESRLLKMGIEGRVL